tara:strand:+ start:3282 stop:3431 length:150 start_codon:yes stop_codon:yes gene_type:complete
MLYRKTRRYRIINEDYSKGGAFHIRFYLFDVKSSILKDKEILMSANYQS